MWRPQEKEIPEGPFCRQAKSLARSQFPFPKNDEPRAKPVSHSQTESHQVLKLEEKSLSPSSVCLRTAMSSCHCGKYS